MQVEEARALLAGSVEDEEPATIPASLLKEISFDDVPDGASFQIGTVKDRVHHMEWAGRIRRDGDMLLGEAEHLWTRKYWYAPLGLEQYMDLVRRAVETRHRLRGDVQLADYDDDGAYIRLSFTITTGEKNPARAYASILKTSGEVEEVAQRAVEEVGKAIADVAARLSGWGEEPLDKLVERVEGAKSTDDKGRTLEELSSRLFEMVPGFSVTGRLRTATEEIDISILNDATEPRLKRESAVILAECKNWTSKCGKDEFVIFREKLENRNRRCSLGFLISWNGFTSTVTKEMLRGSREGVLIVPVTGKDIRAAVRSGELLKELMRCWDEAVSL